MALQTPEVLRMWEKVNNHTMDVDGEQGVYKGGSDDNLHWGGMSDGDHTRLPSLYLNYVTILFSTCSSAAYLSTQLQHL